MSVEIERKFLVKGEYKNLSLKKYKITQGYLCSVPERTVRVRVKGDKAFITIKGIVNDTGTSRYEWEKEISLEEANELLKLCEPGIIDKTRFIIKSGSNSFEVDEFYGDNLGLTIAEIELSAENESFEKPEWLGDEVTGDNRFFNAELMKNPYTKW
ncbi:MAG: CYTH domain-containing protein [Bacteroidales bacterium]|jgi:adenylate cyclase